MLDAFSLTINQLFSKPFRSVFWKSLGLTIALLIGLWLGIRALFFSFITLPYAWLETSLDILTGIGLVVGLGFLIAPVSALFAGLFLDEIAQEVETRHYAHEPAGRAMPVSATLWLTIKFTALVILVNAVCLALVLLPGINFGIFFLANGYLLGREFFEFAALRFRDIEDVKRLRRRKSGTVFVAGLVIAALLSIPVLNLLTPLFATAFMVHMHKRVSGSRPAQIAPAD